MVSKCTRLSIFSAAVLLVAGSVHAQISGNFSYDGSKKAYFIHGDTTVSGNISGNEIFVGKDNAAQFTTIYNPPMTLTVTGAPDGSTGALITSSTLHYVYPNGQTYAGLYGFGNNAINFQGGKITSEMIAHDNSKITMSAGSAGTVGADGTGKINILGGDVANVNIAGQGTGSISYGEHSSVGTTINRTNNRNNGTLNISAQVTDAYSYDHSTTNINMGGVRHIHATDHSYIKAIIGFGSDITADASSRLELSDSNYDTVLAQDYSYVSAIQSSNIHQVTGTGHALLYLGNDSDPLAAVTRVNIVDVSENTATLLNGATIDTVTATGNAFVGIGYGNITNIYAKGNSVFSIYGGNISDLRAYDNSQLNVMGGTIGQHTLRLFDTSAVTIYGKDFSIALVGVGSDFEGPYTNYLLSGTLENGDSINGVNVLDYDGGFQITDPNHPNGPNSPVNFVIVPEASTAALLGLVLPIFGAVALVRYRRK